jgi:drug/metabolite transporter (DMT)-like permease
LSSPTISCQDPIRSYPLRSRSLSAAAGIAWVHEVPFPIDSSFSQGRRPPPDMTTAKEYFLARLPLFYVFVSGIGFSLQALVVKLLAESGFHASFQVIFFRGFIQMMLSCFYMYWDEDRRAGRAFPIFGYSNFVRFCLFMRAFVGYGGIAFTFMAVELISIGDSTVLCMLSPLIASILGFLLLGEPWRIPEFCATVVSLTGAVLVAKPPFIFASNAQQGPHFYEGVTYALMASVFAGTAYIFVRLLGTTAKTKWSIVCFWQSVMQVLMSMPCLYLSGQKLDLHVSSAQLGMMLLAGFIGANSQILMTLGMQREKSAAATAMRMSDVAFGFVWQMVSRRVDRKVHPLCHTLFPSLTLYLIPPPTPPSQLFTHDRVNGLSLLGAFLVSTSILIIVVFKAPPPAPAPSPASLAVVDSESGAVELPSVLKKRLDYEGEEGEEGFTDANSDEDDARAQEAKTSSAGHMLSSLSSLLDYISSSPVVTRERRIHDGYDSLPENSSHAAAAP